MFSVRKLSSKFTFVILYCLLGNGATLAQERQLSVVTEILPPHQMKVGDSLTGVAVELVNEILKEAKINTSITAYPWARAYKMALENPNTLIFSIRRTEAREHKFIWAAPVYTENSPELNFSQAIDRTFLWGANDDTIEIGSMEEAKAYPICTITDGAVGNVVKDNYGWSEDRITHVDSLKSLGNVKSRGRCRFVLASELLIQKYHEESSKGTHALRKVFKVPPPTDPFGLYFAFNVKTNPWIVKSFEKAHQTIVENGTYKRVYRKWAQQHARDD